MVRWALTHRAVNSQLLLNEIHDFIIMGMEDTGVNWSSDVQREAYVQMIDEFMQEVAGENKIEQWDIRCDGRNNSAADMNQGRYVMEVWYRQRHCLNVTKLRYDIDDDELDELEIQF